ncbi:MAG: AraC family transcriptional regulator ligand-binding domain-containing protein [Micropepsaceae bacterium]
MHPLGRNTLLRTIFDVAEIYGVDRNAILDEIELEPALADQPGALIASSKIIDAVEYAAIATGRDDFGLLLGSRQDHRLLGPIGLFVEHCKSVGEAVAEGGRYLYLHNSALLYTLTPGRENYVFRLQIGARGKYPPRQYVEALLTMCIRFCRVMLGAQWLPHGVLLEHQRMAGRAAYRRVFGDNIRFGQHMNALQAPRRDFDQRIGPSDPRIKQMVQRILEDLDQEYAENAPAMVASLLRPLLASGQATAAKLAARMSLTPRTFQRRLAEQRTSYKQILLETRIQIVKEYLPRSGMTVTKLAPILGFSDSTAASRFLREHVGRSATAIKAKSQQRGKTGI